MLVAPLSSLLLLLPVLSRAASSKQGGSHTSLRAKQPALRLLSLSGSSTGQRSAAHWRRHAHARGKRCPQCTAAPPGPSAHAGSSGVEQSGPVKPQGHSHLPSSRLQLPFAVHVGEHWLPPPTPPGSPQGRTRKPAAWCHCFAVRLTASRQAPNAASASGWRRQPCHGAAPACRRRLSMPPQHVQFLVPAPANLQRRDVSSKYTTHHKR